MRFFGLWAVLTERCCRLSTSSLEKLDFFKIQYEVTFRKCWLKMWIFEFWCQAVWTLMAHDFNAWFLTFYISLQITLNDFVISEVQWNLKPSNNRTHIEPNRTELKTENIRTEPEPITNFLHLWRTRTEANLYFC